MLNGESLIGLWRSTLKAKRREMQLVYQDPVRVVQSAPPGWRHDRVSHSSVHGIGTPAEPSCEG